ncbi:hypothetical protein [Seleniivibrio sp.]|uniref:hypothetical protein n=1 Tax=Seleniivibrio sp. TaxID=2898801 RepID=UPI0025D0D5A1|nr:hypothetical protein [Seleniivibrio sp.]MCD8554933.1 hypothetical protein [Seleniivibrio sp.]
MNRILISVGVFILVFAASLWIFFPFGSYIETMAAQSAKNMGLRMKYEGMSSGIFSTELTGVSINDKEIGDFTFHHTPLTLLTKHMSIDVKGIYNAKAKISDSDMEFDVTTSGAALDFIKEPVSLKGNVNLKGKIDTKTDVSQITANVDKMLLKTPLGEMPFENITTDIEAKGKIITINKLRSDDKTELNMQGRVRLNKLNIVNSNVDLQGTIKLAGQKQTISIRGDVDNLHPMLGGAGDSAPEDDE